MLLQTVLPLDSLLRRAAENDASVKASFYTWRAEVEKTSGAAALPEPMVMFRAFVEPGQRAFFRGFEAGVQQTLPWADVRKKSAAAAQFRADAAKHNLRERTFFVQWEVRRVYFDWLREVHLSLQEREQLRLLEQLRSVTEAQIAAGKTSVADLLMLEMQTEMLKKRLADRQSTKTTLLAELQVRTGDAVLPDTVLPGVPNLTPSESQNQNVLPPQLAGAEAMARMTSADVSRMKAEQRPMVTAGFGVMTATPLGTPQTMNGSAMLMPAVTVSLPMFSKKNASDIRVATAEAAQAEALAQNMSREWIRDRVMAQNEIEKIRREYELLVAQELRASQIQKIRMQEYASGTGSFNVTTAALQLLSETIAQKINALTEWHKAIARITYLNGENP
jgi:outer membrane protein TolC